MGRRRRQRSHRVPLPFEALVRLAEQVCELHGTRMALGYELRRSSGCWRRNDGSYTARFVYRRLGDTEVQIVTTVRGLRGQ